MSIMELWCDYLFGVFVQRLSPMEKASPLFVNHFHHRIFSPINNANIIPICLCTIRHEPLENMHTQPFLLNNNVQLPPQNALKFYVLKLHVINYNPHDLIIYKVVNVLGHGRPSLNMFYMIEHHQHILQIITWLHLLN